MATQLDMDNLRASFARKVVSFNIQHPDLTESVKALSSITIRDAPAVKFFEVCDQYFGDDWIWSSSMFSEITTVYFKDPANILIFRLLVDYKVA